jgi:hypothetical protein
LGNQCDFSAGAGSFIGRDGEIIVYVAEHYDGGLDGSIKFEEFRQIDPQSCGGYSDSWVELYDDEGADESDRSVIITYRDWYALLRDYSDFDYLDGFEDKTTSLTYCVAYGTYFSLFEDKNPMAKPQKINQPFNDIVDLKYLKVLSHIPVAPCADGTIEHPHLSFRTRELQFPWTHQITHQKIIRTFTSFTIMM